jgi:hypothetical protein
MRSIGKGNTSMKVLLLWMIFSNVVFPTPFFRQLGPTKWSIGNDLWSIEIGQIYGTNLYYNERDLVGKGAKGFYAGYGMF